MFDQLFRKTFISFIFSFSLLLHLSGSSCAQETAQTKTGILFPFYLYPTQATIQPLLNAKKQYPNVPIRAILNPNSGPGASKNKDYANAVSQLKKAGISVLGYVSTNYGKRKQSLVNKEIENWQSWYRPDGIFLDEMSLNHSYYSQATAFAKSLGVKYVVGNPGTNIDLSAGQDVDTVTIFESPNLPNLSSFNAWKKAYPADKIALLAYRISPLPTKFITDASQTFGWIFITDDGADGNPWDAYPSYFLDLVKLLNTL